MRPRFMCSLSRWCVSDPLPPSAALPLTEGENQSYSPPREGETRAKRARGSLTRHLESGSSVAIRQFREFHRRIRNSRVSQLHYVREVILFDSPWRLRSLLRPFRNRALHVTRGEVFDKTGRRHRWLPVSRSYLGISFLIHVRDKTRDVGANEVGLQCPRRVDIAENGCEVRNLGEHQAFVG